MGKKVKGNGEGSLYKSGKTGLYVGQYTVNGKRHTIYQRKNEKISDFKKRFTSILNNVNTGTYIEKNKDSLYDILLNYIEQKFKDGVVSGRSYKRELGTLKTLARCCQDFIYKPVQNVTIEDVEQSKENYRKYSRSVIEKLWILMSRGFKIAYSRRKTTYNIMENETLTKPISLQEYEKVTALTPEEEKKLNNILDNEERYHKYRNIVKLELLTSMRIGEVLSRTLNDITENGKYLHIHNTLTSDEDGNIIISKHTKTYDKTTGIDHGERYFPLTKEVLQILNEYQKITNIYGLLFWDYEKDTFITPQEVNSWLHRINNKYKISKKLHNHKLRHTRITRWKEQGMDLSAIQYLAGHIEGSSITDEVYIDTTKEYASKQLDKINSIAL